MHLNQRVAVCISFENKHYPFFFFLLTFFYCYIDKTHLLFSGMECRDGYCKNPLLHFGNFDEKSGIEGFLLYLSLTPIILVGILCLLEQWAFIKLWLRKKIRTQHFESNDQDEDDAEVKKEESIVRKEINKR